MNMYLLKMLGQLTHEVIKKLIIDKINIIKSTVKGKHNKKIKELINCYNQSSNSKYREKKSIKIIKIEELKENNKTINLTNINFSNTENIIINNAYKYNLPKDNKQKIIKDYNRYRNSIT